MLANGDCKKHNKTLSLHGHCCEVLQVRIFALPFTPLAVSNSKVMFCLVAGQTVLYVCVRVCACMLLFLVT